jgi:phosphate transport system protein
MLKNFETNLNELKSIISNMANLVEEQLNLAICELESGEANEHKLIKTRDKEINAYENLVLAKCETIFAKFQPVAKELRTIIAVIKINNQLERCGDIAVNISQKVKKSQQAKDLLLDAKIQQLAKFSIQMVNDAIKAFMNEDLELAKKILENEKVVDKNSKENFNYLVEKMKSSPDIIEAGAQLILLIRQLERLADHATNIAEDVYFVVENQIIAHNKKDLFNED